MESTSPEGYAHYTGTDWVFRREKFGALVHNLSSGEMFAINQTGFVILQQIADHNISRFELASFLHDHYGLEDERGFAEIDSFLIELESKGVIHSNPLQDADHRAHTPSPKRRDRDWTGAQEEGFVLTAPNTVSWDVTKNCNLKCTQCYSSSSRRLSNELTTEEAHLLIDQLADMRVFSICLLGGEPLLRRDMFELLEHSIGRRLRTTIFTNGWLVTKERAQRLAKTGLHHIRVSLDGATGDTHDRIRGVRGSFERAVAAITNLRAAGIQKVSVSPTIMRENFHECEALIDFAYRLGADEIRIGQICNVGRAKPISNLSSQQIIALRSLVSAKSREYRGTIQISGSEGIWEDKPHRQAVTSGALKPHFMGCGGGRSLAAISPEGIVRCCILHDFPVGDLRKNTFEEIWNGAAGNMDALRTTRPECKDCYNVNVCGGPCRLQRFCQPEHKMTAVPHTCTEGENQCQSS